MSADGSDDVGAAAKLGQSPAGRLPKSMDRRLSGQAGFAAPALEPMRKHVGTERAAASRRQKREMIGRCRLEDRPQLGMQRDRQRRPRLRLADVDQVVTDMRAAHVNNVRATLRGVEQQYKREPRPTADRVLTLKSSDVLLGPSVESRGPEFGSADAGRRVL